MGRRKDRFWGYAEELPSGRFKCRFCGQEFAGGATRIKAHLASVPGRDISTCMQVPQDVQKEALEAIGGPCKKFKGMPSSGNFDKNKSASASSSSPSNALHLHPTNGELPGDENKIAVDKLLARHVVLNGLPVDVFQTASFRDFMQGVVKYGPGYMVPSQSTFQTKLIPDLETEVGDYVRDVKKSWATTGCTLMLNLRRDKKLVDFIDINAYSHKGVVFMNSFELQNKKNEELGMILSVVIENIGPDNVVQLITNDKELESIGEVLIRMYPRMYMTGCAAQGIQLLLKHICKEVSWVKKLINDAYSIVKYIYNCNDTTSLMRKYSKMELKRPCVARFSSYFLMLQSIFDVKHELQSLVASSEWQKVGCDNEDKRGEVTNVIANPEFWSQIQEVLQVLTPILRVLQLAETNGSTFGYLYESVERAKEEIKQQCDNNQQQYKRILEIFEEKYSRNIIHPVHAAAAFLNPSYMCRETFHLDSKMKDGIAFILENIVATEEQECFAVDLDIYREKALSLFTKIAKTMLKTTHPYKWWDYCGDCVSILRKYSIRILSQPCSSICSSYEQDWTTSEAVRINKGNQLAVKTSENFLFLKINTMMMEKSRMMETQGLKPIDLNNLSELPDYTDHEQDWEDDLLHVIDADLNMDQVKAADMSQLEQNVGEYASYAFLEQLVHKLDSIELQEFVHKMQVNVELKKLQTFWLDICVVVDDAEEKQMEDSSVKNWLRDIRDLAYDADDILDEISSRHKMTVEYSQANSIDMADIKDMEFKIEAISSKLQDIVSQIHKFNLRKKVEKRTYELREAPFTAPLVCGRDKDKEAIIDLLLGDETSNKMVIVGEAGVGKTTLARLVYNEAKVDECFDLKAWAYVSEEYNHLKIIKSIIWEIIKDSAAERNWICSDFLDELECALMEALSGKKFLIILDDVWNVSSDQWYALYKIFVRGATGSKIVVTTRDESIATTMGCICPYHLEKLSFEDAFSLFTHHAQGIEFCNGHPNLKRIGEKLVKRCKGLPLAVKIVGGLLRSELDCKDWEDILNNKTWSLPEEGYDLLSILRLGYRHLPSHLKRCFVYCGIFPKGYEFDKDELVSLWMAEEFLPEWKGKYRAKDLGLQYFFELVSRSFFQQSYDNQSSFVMHDLISDLAKSVAGEMCFDSKCDTLDKAVDKVRHLSFTACKYDSFERFGVFSQMKGLRTFLALNTQALHNDCYLSSKVLHELLPELRYLRVLSLRGYQIKVLPESIGVLKHLRHLNLSHSAIESLPESLGALLSLKTLALRGCKKLIELPSTIGNLVELNHLDILDTDDLLSMPSELGKLRNLQTLPKFIVREDNELSIRDLGNFPNLQGQLSILGLCNVAEIDDAEIANLEGLRGLDELTLDWSHDDDDMPKLIIDDPFLHLRELQVLERLQPHRNLRQLRITSYASKQFPTWIGDSSFSNLQQLSICNCKESTLLPSLGQLPLLKTLSIEGMDALQFINEGFYGFDSPPFKAFPSLESLCFRNMSNWEEWSRIEGAEIFPLLRKLELKECPKLIGELPGLLGSLDDLHISSCPMLQTSFASLPSLRELKIENCNCAFLSGLVNLTSLTTMKIHNILDLFGLNLEFLNALEVLEITKCNELITLWEGGVNPSNLAGLKKLVIESCPKLTSLAGEEGWLLPPNLEELKIGHCRSLVKLPNGLHSLTCLKSLTIKSCDKPVSFPATSLPYTLKQL